MIRHCSVAALALVNENGDLARYPKQLNQEAA